MKICLLNGGLGNQVFQYIFARYIEIATGEPCYLDDSYFFNLSEARKEEERTGSILVHNGYEIEKVFPNAKPNLLSRQFTPDIWEYMVEQCGMGVSIPQQLLDIGTDIHLVLEAGQAGFNGEVIQIPANQYYPEILEIKKENIYYFGYWIAKGWLWEHRELIREELRFPPITNKRNRRYQDDIKACNSVGVHIRRGDFVDLGWALGDLYYELSISSLDKAFKGDCVFFVFSDDLDWCRANARGLGLELAAGRVVYVEGNCDRKYNYVDMQLMTMCRHLIIANSSFSYLAALLHPAEHKIIIAPPGQREI